MNKRQPSQLKRILFPTLIYMIIGFSALFLIYISIILCLAIEIINFIIYLFIIFIRLNNYKLRFFFLGKKFEKYLNEYLVRMNKSIDSISKYAMKYEKDLYRKTGKAFQFVLTPYTKIQDLYNKKQFTDVNGEFNIDNPKLDLLILSELYLKMNLGAGLYGLFELINNELSYDDFYIVINKSSYFNNRIKELLLDDKIKRIYSLINHENELDDIKSGEIKEFELNYSVFKDDDLKILIKDFNDMAISLYILDEVKKGLNNNACLLLFNIEKRKRIQIIKEDNSYYGIVENFIFYEDNDEEIYNSGSFIEASDKIGIYMTIDDLIEDNEGLLFGFERIILK